MGTWTKGARKPLTVWECISIGHFAFDQATASLSVYCHGFCIISEADYRPTKSFSNYNVFLAFPQWLCWFSFGSSHRFYCHGFCIISEADHRPAASISNYDFFLAFPRLLCWFSFGSSHRFGLRVHYRSHCLLGQADHGSAASHFQLQRLTWFRRPTSMGISTRCDF